jgi:hypothetical protein
MIIAFNCSQQTKQQMDALLAAEGYADYAQIIEIAVNNLATLQAEMNNKPSLILDGGVSAPAKPRRPAAVQRTLSEPVVERVPSIFLPIGLDKRPARLASLPEDNKILPAKATCRALAHLLVEEPHGVPLDKTAARIAEEATRLGDFLSKHDDANGPSRDERLSTAFPTSGKNADKAQVRYASQFVAYADKQGRLFGLPYGLKLINCVQGDQPRILLTEVGWEFARMPNPVLDATDAPPRHKLSDDEKRLLLAHIVRSVPVEDFAYRAVLAAVSEGADTPDRLDKTLWQYAPASRKMKDSYMSTQRSGSISRMADLGLVRRVREGTRVCYAVTDSGGSYASVR